MNQTNSILKSAVLLLFSCFLSTLLSAQNDSNKTPTLPLKLRGLTIYKEAAFPRFDTIGSNKNGFKRLQAKMNVKTKQPQSFLKFLRKDLSSGSIKFVRGNFQYNYNYQSNLDTPFVDREIGQHQLMVSADLILAKRLPITVTGLIRRSNTDFLRNITDFQVRLNVEELQATRKRLQFEKMLAIMPSTSDSLTRILYGLKKLRYQGLQEKLKDSFSLQHLTQAHELINIQELTKDLKSTPAANKAIHDSITTVAITFLKRFETLKSEALVVEKEIDSINHVLIAKKAQLDKWRSAIGTYSSLSEKAQRQLRKEMQTQGIVLPERGRHWIDYVRKLEIGRSFLNHSDLITKNLTLSGLNFEYSRKYYFAISAGLVNYQFRDFVRPNYKKSPQYLSLVKAGVGIPERSHLFFSLFRGRKQLYASTSSNLINTAFDVSGISVEGKILIRPRIYVQGEVAQSFSPNLHKVPIETKTNWKITDNTARAVAIKFYAHMIKAGLRLEGGYKYTGPNYQAFNSYQPNSLFTSWHIRGEQAAFRRQLSINFSIDQNEFSNPFLLQTYKANTVFANLTATLRLRKLPFLTLGYMPTSQYSFVDSQIVENRFQTLMASIGHYYNIGQAKAATSVIYSRFFNSNSDTAFIFFNSDNLFVNHSFYFSSFSMSLSISNNHNSIYQYTVLENRYNMAIPKIGNIEVGAKVSNLNGSAVKLGGNLGCVIPFNAQNVLSLHFEKGFLPSVTNSLIPNTSGTISFSKTLR